jgi:hypothetical protein
MPTEISANLSEGTTCPWRVLHLLRPAEGGMRAQVAFPAAGRAEGRRASGGSAGCPSVPRLRFPRRRFRCRKRSVG